MTRTSKHVRLFVTLFSLTLVAGFLIDHPRLPYPAAAQAVDSDGDGCSDAAELGPNPTLGGRRDPTNPWDFFDTPTSGMDGRVSVGDISGVVNHFGEAGDPDAPLPSYDPRYDRGPPAPGGDPWDTGPPDGTVATGDIAAVVSQIGHHCAPSSGALDRLPDHFFLGMANSPESLSWMTGSGVPWDARYQYLTTDWTRWNSPSGQFALNYMRNSRDNGYLPVFTFYQLVPLSGYDEGAGLLATLRNSTTMTAYYNEFRLLMNKAREFGGTVIVHVEPDVWGHLEQRNETALARSLAQNLVAIRNQLAPNVLLAYHASPWGSGFDVALNNNTSIDVAAAAREDAAFYNGLGASFDLVFSEASDRDAGYYQVARGTSARWWTSANFARFRQYLSTLRASTGKPIVIWQIPIGNTVYRTMNNTTGHYRDNRVQTWLTQQGIADLRAAGVVGLLFGAGAGDQTHNTDNRRDGVTNPAGIGGSTAVSTVADDDGGLLRERGAAYYDSWGPVPLP
jgi:hypothetical protein